MIKDSKNMNKVALFSAILIALPSIAKADGKSSFSIGTPGIFNFTARGEVAGLPLQAAFGYGRVYYGVELGYPFYRRESGLFRSVQLIAGTIREGDGFPASSYWSNDEFESNYAGVSTTIQYGRFFMEPGLVVGSEDHENPLVSFQIGWFLSE